jgi:hypothetical protein
MTIQLTRTFLLWCTVTNCGVLLVWFLVFVFAHDWILHIRFIDSRAQGHSTAQ